MNDLRTVRLVILFLGVFGLAALTGTVALVAGLVIWGPDPISPEVVALVIPVGNLASAALGALGAVLVSTGSVDVPGLEALAAAKRDAAPEPAEVDPEG